MKDIKGDFDVDDQYGELTKGKEGEESSVEFMKLIEDYEKMHMAEQKKEDLKSDKPHKSNGDVSFCRS